METQNRTSHSRTAIRKSRFCGEYMIFRRSKTSSVIVTKITICAQKCDSSRMKEHADHDFDQEYAHMRTKTVIHECQRANVFPTENKYDDRSLNTMIASMKSTHEWQKHFMRVASSKCLFHSLTREDSSFTMMTMASIKSARDGRHNKQVVCFYQRQQQCIPQNTHIMTATWPQWPWQALRVHTMDERTKEGAKHQKKRKRERKEGDERRSPKRKKKMRRRRKKEPKKSKKTKQADERRITSHAAILISVPIPRHHQITRKGHGCLVHLQKPHVRTTGCAPRILLPPDVNFIKRQSRLSAHHDFTVDNTDKQHAFCCHQTAIPMGKEGYKKPTSCCHQKQIPRRGGQRERNKPNQSRMEAHHDFTVRRRDEQHTPCCHQTSTPQRGGKRERRKTESKQNGSTPPALCAYNITRWQSTHGLLSTNASSQATSELRGRLPCGPQPGAGEVKPHTEPNILQQ